MWMIRACCTRSASICGCQDNFLEMPPGPCLRRIGVMLSVCTGNRSRFVRALHETANVQEFAASASRRSFAARAVSRKSGSGSFRRGSNSTSKDLMASVPMTMPRRISAADHCWRPVLRRPARDSLLVRAQRTLRLRLSPLGLTWPSRSGIRTARAKPSVSTCDTGQTIW